MVCQLLSLILRRGGASLVRFSMYIESDLHHVVKEFFDCGVGHSDLIAISTCFQGLAVRCSPTIRSHHLEV